LIDGGDNLSEIMNIGVRGKGGCGENAGLKVEIVWYIIYNKIHVERGNDLSEDMQVYIYTRRERSRLITGRVWSETETRIVKVKGEGGAHSTKAPSKRKACDSTRRGWEGMYGRAGKGMKRSSISRTTFWCLRRVCGGDRI